MARSPRSSLWADVVLNLVLLSVVTIAVNALLTGKVVQGREADLRAALAAEVSRDLALRVAVAGTELDRLEASSDGPWQEALDAAVLPEGEPFFAVLTNAGLEPVAVLGEWPQEVSLSGGESDPLGRTQWLLDATDLRGALVGRRTERGEWQARPGFFTGTVYAAASSPVIRSGRVAGAVRVVVPVGTPFFGPVDRRTLQVLALSMLASAIILVVFGYFLFRGRILVPMEALVSGTKELAAGNFSTRLPPGPANELGEMARVFNDMAIALERYRSTNEEQLAELREINADLSRAREDLIFAEKMATVGRLAAGVAHEVGNPLASVIGFVEILENDDGEMADDLLPRIRTELDRIHRIIRDLLSYARPSDIGDTDQPGLVVEAVSVIDVISTAAQLVTAQPRFAHVEFDVQLREDLPRAHVDAGRLQQILLNLFVNAGEALQGQGRITVAERADERVDGMLRLAVEDDGPGVDPRARSNLFEPFFTTKDVGAGTGLGLAVSARIVEQMGGSLHLDRNHAGGACFHLDLPVVEEAAS